jgi:hypothetical protein
MPGGDWSMETMVALAYHIAINRFSLIIFQEV